MTPHQRADVGSRDPNRVEGAPCGEFGDAALEQAQQVACLGARGHADPRVSGRGGGLGHGHVWSLLEVQEVMGEMGQVRATNSGPAGEARAARGVPRHTDGIRGDPADGLHELERRDPLAALASA